MTVSVAPEPVKPTDEFSHTTPDGVGDEGTGLGSYGAYPKTIRDHPTLSGGAKFVWITLASFGRVVAGRVINIFPSRKLIARTCGWRDEATVDRYLRELAVAGLMKKQPRYDVNESTGKARQTSNQYLLTWPAETEGERSTPPLQKKTCAPPVEPGGGLLEKPDSRTTAKDPVEVRQAMAPAAPSAPALDSVIPSPGEDPQELSIGARARGLAATFDRERMRMLPTNVDPIQLEHGVLRNVGHRLLEAGLTVSEVPDLVRWIAGHSWTLRRDLLRYPQPLRAPRVAAEVVSDWRAEGEAPRRRDVDAEQAAEVEAERVRRADGLRQKRYLMKLCEGAWRNRACDEAQALARDVIHWRQTVPGFLDLERTAWRRGGQYRPATGGAHPTDQRLALPDEIL